MEDMEVYVQLSFTSEDNEAINKFLLQINDFINCHSQKELGSRITVFRKPPEDDPFINVR